MLLIQKSQPLENNINFLGQTPLHIAIRRPSRLKALLDAGHNVNARDKNGITALMYAAAMNRQIALSILISRGADLCLHDNLNEYDFIMYAAVRNNWFLIWHAVNVIGSRDASLLPAIFSMIIRAPKPPLFLKEGQIWRKCFWISVGEKLRGLNVCFEDGTTLMHAADLPQDAEMLVQFGFTAFNQQDSAGEHSMFKIKKFLNPRLFQRFLDKGADINLQNHKGHTVLHRVIDRLTNPNAKEIKNLLDSLETLLSGGANITLVDHCACSCSPGGCLPISALSLKVQGLLGMIANNPFWIFEWLYMLEEHGQLVEAKAHALSVLRRAKFDERGLHHTCCRLGGNIDMDLDENRFWDIPTQIELDKLSDEIQTWEASNYDEIKLELMTNLKNQSKKNEEAESEEIGTTLEPDVVQSETATYQTKEVVSAHVPASIMVMAVNLTLFILGPAP